MENIAQILTNNRNILEINYDFNKYRINHNSFFKTKQDELKVRYENLQDIITVLNKYKIQYWLQGKTMLGICKYSKLLENDSDEDIGLDYKSIFTICNKVIPELNKIGFKVIRATKNNSMVSVIRNNRYLDFCFFRSTETEYFYEQKRFPKHFYDNIITINVNNFSYCIPKKYNEICKYSYNI